MNGRAEAFLCDGRNERLQGEALPRPRRRDEEIRVCFVPQPETRESGIYFREIGSFFFEQGGERTVCRRDNISTCKGLHGHL